MAEKIPEVVRASPEAFKASLKEASLQFGVTELKKQQEKAVEASLCGKNVFASLPTGYGKSLIYQLLPLCVKELASKNLFISDFHPFILVISPLISLMQDQVTSLKCRGLNAALCTREKECEQFDPHNYAYLFASPEAILGDSRWRKTILSSVFQDNILALVIDEAHCIAKW